MGCEPIRAGPMGPDFIRAANFMARTSKISGQFGPAYRARPIFPALDIIEVPSSIRHLQGLEYLDFSCCPKLSSFSDDICSSSSLNTLQVVGCPIMSFLGIMENMERLGELDLSKTDRIQVPS